MDFGRPAEGSETASECENEKEKDREKQESGRFMKHETTKSMLLTRRRKWIESGRKI